MTYIIELPNGQQVGAGASLPALASVKITASAFAGTEADPGGVCSAELAAEFYSEGMTLHAGDELKLYRDGVLAGTFTAEKPTAAGEGRLKVLAYDRVSALDRDMTSWLESLTDWPYSLSAFASMVCEACGLSLEGDLENGDWPIPRFRARNITARQLMQWVCQAGCRFCRAKPDGGLRLDWVQNRSLTLGHSGSSFYFGGMTHGEHIVPTPDGVQIALTESDIGVVSGADARNLLTIRGNYLLCGCDESVAQNIASHLAPPYTPCALETVTPVEPGQLFTVQTEKGDFTALAMTVEETAGRFRVTGTGCASRSDSSAVCRGDYRAMSGRVLEMSLELQGVSTRLAQYDGALENYSQLTQDVDGLTGRVGTLESDTETNFTQLTLRSDGMDVKVAELSAELSEKADGQTLEELHKHFRFDSEGLTISDSGSGMYICISEEAVAFQDGTSITPVRMTTTDLQVENSLRLGDFSLIPRTSGNLSLRYTGF